MAASIPQVIIESILIVAVSGREQREPFTLSCQETDRRGECYRESRTSKEERIGLWLLRYSYYYQICFTHCLAAHCPISEW